MSAITHTFPLAALDNDRSSADNHFMSDSVSDSVEAIMERFREAALKVRKENKDPAKARAFLIGLASPRNVPGILETPYGCHDGSRGLK